jgi:E3 ubiquitin-protein ligase DOA10
LDFEVTPASSTNNDLECAICLGEHGPVDQDDIAAAAVRLCRCRGSMHVLCLSEWFQNPTAWMKEERGYRCPTCNEKIQDGKAPVTK